MTERKIRAWARVLANGLRGDVPLDHGRIIVKALQELEEPHIQVLHAMIVDAPPPVADKIGKGAWTRAQLQVHLPGLARSSNRGRAGR